MRLLGTNHRTGELIRTEIIIEIEESGTISVEFENDEKFPTTQTLFWALLADEDVRDLIREYQVSDRNPFKIRRIIPYYGSPTQYWVKEKGKAEERLIYKEFEPLYGKAYPYYLKKLKIDIGDFTELSAFLELTDDMEIRALRKKAQVSYVYNYDTDDEGFHLKPYKILL